MDALKSQTNFVLVTGANLYEAPQIVQDAMASKEAEGPIPIVAVTDSKVERLVGVVPYLAMKDVNGFTAVKKSLDDILGTKEGAPVAPRKPEKWTDVRGRSITAAFVGSTADEVTLRLPSGKTATIPVTQLDDAGRARVKELSAH